VQLVRFEFHSPCGPVGRHSVELIRSLIVQADAIHDVAMDRMSFKGTVDASRQYSIAIAQARSQKKQRELIDQLLRVIAWDQVPDRPGRREPRAVKRRPKPYPLLNKPRKKFKEIPHRNRYWKNNPRKTRGETTCHSGQTPLRPLYGSASQRHRSFAVSIGARHLSATKMCPFGFLHVKHSVVRHFRFICH